MNILLCITDNLWEPLIVLVNSLIINNGHTTITFYICYDELTDEHSQIISEFVLGMGGCIKLIKIEKKEIYPNYKKLRMRLPLESYFYIFAINELEGIERILYLDADTVCNGSLWELWNMNMDGLCVAGRPVDSWDNSYERMKAGMKPNSLFVNSGVLLLNLIEIRKFYKIQDVIMFLDSYNEYQYWYADQIFINVYFEGKIGAISEVYNRFCGEKERMWNENKSNAIIYHYAGSQTKPWHPYTDGVYLYDLSIYNKYCDLEALTNEFKNRISENVIKYRNNIWIVMKSCHLRRRGGVSEKQILFDYFNEEQKHGDIFNHFCEKYGYKRIALYGYSNIALLLADKIKRRRLSKREVCIVDRKSMSITNDIIKVMQPTNFKTIEDEFDVLIVMIVNEFYSICEYLRELGFRIEIVSLAEIIYCQKNGAVCTD